MEVAAAMGGHRGKVSRAAEKGERDQAIAFAKKAGVFVALLVLVVGLVFGIRHLSGGAAPSVGDDAEARKLISNGYTELTAWIDGRASQQRFLNGHNPTQSRRRAEELYNLGAARVLAGGPVLSLRMIIELPDDAEARDRLIHWGNDWNRRYFPGTPRIVDEGQRYVIMQMPLNL